MTATPTIDIAGFLADGWAPLGDEGFIALIGPFYLRERSGTVQFAFPTDRRHHNLRGVLQGGALMTFADRSLGAATTFHSRHPRVTTIQLDVNFVDAVQIGEVVETTPEVTRVTRSLVFLRASLTVAGRVVGTAQGIWKLLA